MTDDSPGYVVSTYIEVTDPSQVARAAEVLGRAVAGLALEGIAATLSVRREDDT